MSGTLYKNKLGHVYYGYSPPEASGGGNDSNGDLSSNTSSTSIIDTNNFNEDFYNSSNNLFPAFDNLYIIEIFPSGLSNENNINFVKNYIKFQATSVFFGSENLNLKRHEITKKFHFGEGSGYTRSDELKITWRENETWKVKKYHEDWLSLFYDRNSDYYLSDSPIYGGSDSGSSYRYRDFRITLPRFNKSGKDTPEIIYFERVLPHNTGDLSLKWNQSPSVISHNLTYYVENWYWKTSK